MKCFNLIYTALLQFQRTQGISLIVWRIINSNLLVLNTITAYGFIAFFGEERDKSLQYNNVFLTFLLQ